MGVEFGKANGDEEGPLVETRVSKPQKQTWDPSPSHVTVEQTSGQ